jgi:hypothetical protein
VTAEDAVRLDDGWRLADEREFLVRSLADAVAEHAAGDLDDHDFDALQRRDQSRLVEVEKQMAELERAHREAGTNRSRGATGDPAAPDVGRGGPADPTIPATRHRRTWLAMLGTALVVAAAIVLVLRLTSPRLPGQNGDGGVQLNSALQVEKELEQATVLVDQGTTRSDEQALTVYKQVLAQDPTQPQALAESGYLLWEAGVESGDAQLISSGRARVVKSISVEHDFSAAHLFLGNIDLESGGTGSGGAGDGTAARTAAALAAVAEYRLFLAEGPPLSMVRAAAPLIRKAFSEAGQPLPGTLPVPGSATSSGSAP